MYADRVQTRLRGEGTGLPARTACPRCAGHADPETMRLWSERRRFRLADPTKPGGFRYAYGHRHFAVCTGCFAELIDGGRIGDLRHRRGVAVLLSAIVLGVLAALLIPVVLPQLMSAFWRMGV